MTANSVRSKLLKSLMDVHCIASLAVSEKLFSHNSSFDALGSYCMLTELILYIALKLEEEVR